MNCVTFEEVRLIMVKLRNKSNSLEELVSLSKDYFKDQVDLKVLKEIAKDFFTEDK